MANNMFAHFLQRTKERYGLDLTLNDLKDIAERIKSGRAKLTKITTHSFQYKVRAQGKQLVVVLNRNHSYFITALPYNKYTDKVTFDKHTYSYEDAIYVTYILRKFFGAKTLEHKIYCKNCHSTSMRVELSKNRIKCMNCHNIIRLPQLEQPKVSVLKAKRNKFELEYHLSEDLWWFLYKSKTMYKDLYVELRPVLEDGDCLRYIINGKTVKPLGKYTLEQLKEGETND